MDTQAQSAAISFPSVIKLNVGGQIYTTSLATLTKYSESMLGAMFSGRFAAQKDSNGNYFIDRDGALFRYVLDFLRNGELQVLENPHEFGPLLKEAEFFQIPALTDAVKQQMQSRDGHKSTDKPEKTEVITMFGNGDENGYVKSMSGRLCTLLEMFHIGDWEHQQFQCSPYGNQSDRSDSERTCIMTVRPGFSSVAPKTIIAVATLHGFKFSGEQCAEFSQLDNLGNRCWILTRPIP